MIHRQNAKSLNRKFRESQKILTAFGNEVRQRLLLLMIAENRKEIQAAEIAKRTDLTRPAVSHHMQILKDAGIVKSRKEGKCVYYSFDSSCKNVDVLLDLFQDVKRVIQGAENKA